PQGRPQESYREFPPSSGAQALARSRTWLARCPRSAFSAKIIVSNSQLTSSPCQKLLRATVGYRTGKESAFHIAFWCSQKQADFGSNRTHSLDDFRIPARAFEIELDCWRYSGPCAKCCGGRENPE